MRINSPGVVMVFKALADETRLAIIARLAQRESRVVDLMNEFGLPQSTVSGHLATLRDAGLVRGRAAGRQTFYALTRPDALELISAAERFAGTGTPQRHLRR